jgi:hypothetical protein
LRGNDEIWKYWILSIFGGIVKDNLFQNEIKRIAQNPTSGEIDAEVYELVNEIIINKL